MARIARVVHPDCPFHVTHRGNRRGAVFLDDEAPHRYLELLRETTAEEGVRVWAYCLMPNHVHLIVVPDRLDSLARGIGRAHRRFSRWVNRGRKWTGHLWANRFYSCPLDEEHLWVATRYVELNPVRAGLVARPEVFPWSSARAHAMGLDDPLLAADRPFPGGLTDWPAWLLEGCDDARIETVREGTATGRPAGSDEFTRRLEQRLGRTLLRRPRGPARNRA